MYLSDCASYKRKDLIKAYKRLLLSKADSIFGVTKFDYPIAELYTKKTIFFILKKIKIKIKDRRI